MLLLNAIIATKTIFRKIRPSVKPTPCPKLLENLKRDKEHEYIPPRLTNYFKEDDKVINGY